MTYNENLPVDSVLVRDLPKEIREKGKSLKQLHDVHTSKKATKTELGHVYAHRGALLRLNTHQSIAANVQTSISWGYAEYDDLSFFNISNPTALTIPSGVSKVRLVLNVASSTVGGNYGVFNFASTITKNGTSLSQAYDGKQVETDLSVYLASSIITPVIKVNEGDFFVATIRHSAPSPISFGINSSFALEVIE